MLKITPEEINYLRNKIIQKGSRGNSKEEYHQMIDDLRKISGTEWEVRQLQSLFSKIRKQLGIRVDLSTCGALRGRIKGETYYATGGTGGRKKIKEQRTATLQLAYDKSNKKGSFHRFAEMFDQIDLEHSKEIEDLKYQLGKRNALCLQSKEIREIATKISSSDKTEEQFSLISDLIMACKNYHRKYEE